MYREMELPVISEKIVEECLDECPQQVDSEYIKAFIMNGQTIVQDIIYSEEISEDEDGSMGLIL